MFTTVLGSTIGNAQKGPFKFLNLQRLIGTKKEEKPVVEEPVVEPEPVVEEPVAEEPVVEEPAAEPAPEPAPAPVNVITGNNEIPDGFFKSETSDEKKQQIRKQWGIYQTTKKQGTRQKAKKQLSDLGLEIGNIDNENIAARTLCYKKDANS